MLITELEAIILRQPEVDASRADGGQDTLLIRIHTDDGRIGLGEVDSSPLPIVDGFAEVSTRPGLGVQLDGSIVRTYAI